MATHGITSGRRQPGPMLTFVLAALVVVSLAVLTVQATSLWSGRSHPAVGGLVALHGSGAGPMAIHGFRQPSVPIEYQDPRTRLTLRQIEAKKSGDGHR